MAYRLKNYLYNDKLTKEQNILMDRLYKLRMSGMAEAFEKQLLEPNTGLEPFEARFAAIVNQEWDQRESKKFKRLMKKATLKYPAADLDSSIYDPERQLNTHVIELLSKCEWIDEPNNLLMTGGAGAGKTHIACALCITAMHQNRTVKYIRANTLLKESEHARQEGTYFEYSNEMAAYDLMVIDDFGLMDLDIEKCRDLFETVCREKKSRNGFAPKLTIPASFLFRRQFWYSSLLLFLISSLYDFIHMLCSFKANSLFI